MYWSQENKMFTSNADEMVDSAGENNMLSSTKRDPVSIPALQVEQEGVESDFAAPEEQVGLSGTCCFKLMNPLFLQLPCWPDLCDLHNSLLTLCPCSTKGLSPDPVGDP